MSDRVAVRPAVAGDAEAIAAIHVRAWQQTYRHLVDTERLDALDPADRVERWRDNILTDGQAVFVGELDGVVVAWATAAVRDAAEHPRALEVNGIYALASAHGSGVGQALLDAAIGTAGAFLWVAADNPRAQAFYRRNGFRPDGQTEHYELLGSPVLIARWVR
jgi:ribosomal protein S18 acetylase RimI-like enzyme